VGIFWDWQERDTGSVNACKKGTDEADSESGKADKYVEAELDEHTCEKKTNGCTNKYSNKETGVG
jgi:hypothetical protein